MRVVTLLLVGLVACGRQGDPEKCEEAVRNYATLMYWRNADKEIEKAPAEQRDKLRRDHLADYSVQMNKGVQTLVTQCISANDMDTINCMIAAKTAAQAEKCAPRAETK